MQEQQPLESEQAIRPRLHQPTYTRSSQAELQATFPNHVVVPVESNRHRAYPGLPGDCPATAPFYALLKDLARGAQRVLDAGSGSGMGAALLVDDFPEVIGLDNHALAVDFARNYVGNARFLQHDLLEPLPLTGVQAAIVVDVLGHVRVPAKLLRSIRTALDAQATLLVGEPRAWGMQSLLAPARQAFSKRSLERTLLYGGFEPEAWLGENSFICCSARPLADDHWDSLARAQEALLRSDAGQALTAFVTARHSPTPAIRVESLVGEGLVCLAFQQVERAARSFLVALELAPHETRALMGLAKVAALTNENGKALELALQALELDPTNAESLFMVAEMAGRLGQATEALNALRLAHALEPSHREIGAELGRQFAGRGDFSQAIAIVERLQSYGDDASADLHVTLGWLLLNAGRRDEALLEARLARAKAPQEPAVSELFQALA